MIPINLEPLKPGEKFKFLCYKGIECFNKCCRNLSFDPNTLRHYQEKNRLGISSSEFLEKYTVWHIGYNTGLPVVMLKMNGVCPFVSDEECTIYPDRPGSCRLYPLVRIKTKDDEYYYALKDEYCKGFYEDREWTIEEWIDDQGVKIYNEMNDFFMKIILAKNKSRKELSDEEIKMIYTACFDIDSFRDYALNKGIISYPMDDLELMKFAINWVVSEMFTE